MPEHGAKPDDCSEDPDGPGNGMTRLEQELNRYLARAHELGEQAKRSNDAVEEELRLTRQIASALRDLAHDE